MWIALSLKLAPHRILTILFLPRLVGLRGKDGVLKCNWRHICGVHLKGTGSNVESGDQSGNRKATPLRSRQTAPGRLMQRRVVLFVRYYSQMYQFSSTELFS